MLSFDAVQTRKCPIIFTAPPVSVAIVTPLMLHTANNVSKLPRLTQLPNKQSLLETSFSANTRSFVGTLSINPPAPLLLRERTQFLVLLGYFRSMSIFVFIVLLNPQFIAVDDAFRFLCRNERCLGKRRRRSPSTATSSPMFVVVHGQELCYQNRSKPATQAMHGHQHNENHSHIHTHAILRYSSDQHCDIMTLFGLCMVALQCKIHQF